MMKSAANETFLIWWAKWQKQNADAIKELQEKHGVRILRTPPDILVGVPEGLGQARRRGRRRRTRSSRKCTTRSAQYASVVVPAKRFYFPPYSFAANYYWPEGGGKGAGRQAGGEEEVAGQFLNGGGESAPV